MQSVRCALHAPVYNFFFIPRVQRTSEGLNAACTDSYFTLLPYFLPIMTNIHLLVLIHGMWGNPAHIAELDRIARETYSDAGSDGTVLHVLKAESIRDNSTYDGVDWGGERIAKEVCLCNLKA